MVRSVLREDNQPLEIIVIDDDPITTIDGGMSPTWAFNIGYQAGFLATLFTALGVVGVTRYSRARNQLEGNAIPSCSMAEFKQRNDPKVCKQIPIEEDTHELYVCKSDRNPRGACFLDIAKTRGV